jgi:hypothetical protein
VPSRCFFILSANVIIIDENVRCTEKLGSPENEGISRCRAHTDALVEELELGVLWDEYGLVGDIVVIVQVSNFHLLFQTIHYSIQ